MLNFLGQLANIGWDIAKTDINNGAATQRERDARRENFEYNEQAANNSDMRTRLLYQDLYSPQAQVQQLKEAGLSPSVYYNGGAAGMSGQTGAQGAGAAGISPNVFGLGELDFSQIAKTIAETRLLNAEADEKEGKNEMGKAKIADYLASAGYKKEAAKLVNAQEEGQNLQNYITTQGANAILHTIFAKATEAGYKAEEAYESLEQAKLLTTLNRETLLTEIEMRKEGLNSLIQGIAESKSRTRLNNQQIETLKAHALKLFNDITVDNQQVSGYIAFINKRIEQMPKELEATFKDLDIKERKMYIDAVTETVKSIAIGAMAAAQWKGGNPTTGKGAGGKVPTGKRGGNAVNHNQYNSGNDIWNW